MRSKVEEFQKFHLEESLLKMKSISIDEGDNKISEEQNDAATRRLEALEFKDKGNTFVKGKEYESAVKMYTRAIELCNDDPVFFSNRSQCFLTLERYKECIEDANRAIELDPKSFKSLYRRMAAYEKLGDDFRALQSCRQWLDVAPDDQSCKNAYDRIHNRIIDAEKKKDKEKIRWSRLGINSEVTNFVTKPPHLRSKRPMKNIPVRLRKAASPIPEAIIDKIFGNNTGENLPEPETDSKLFKPNFLLSPSAGSPPKIAKLEEKPKVQVPMIIDEKKKLDETNEILKAQKEQVMTMEELETHKNHLIVLPASGPQFSGAWKELSDIQRFLYLKNIVESNKNIGKLLGPQLDNSMLKEIIHTIHKYFPLHQLPCIRLLNDLGKNSEMSLLAMFLEEAEKKSKLNKLSVELLITVSQF